MSAQGVKGGERERESPFARLDAGRPEKFKRNSGRLPVKAQAAVNPKKIFEARGTGRLRRNHSPGRGQKNCPVDRGIHRATSSGLGETGKSVQGKTEEREGESTFTILDAAAHEEFKGKPK
jgi:hypothetical protein